MTVLMGTGRDNHTCQLADALKDAEKTEDDVLEISVPEITQILDDDITDRKEDDVECVATEISDMSNENDELEMESGSGSTHELFNNICSVVQPIVCLEDVAVQSNLIVRDDIEVKKEELDDSKRVSFTSIEDSYLKAGCKKYSTSKTKWADILKDPGYKFRSCRTRDSLLVRANSLKNSKRRSSIKQ